MLIFVLYEVKRKRSFIIFILTLNLCTTGFDFFLPLIVFIYLFNI